jgi:hypothetical protein
MIIQWTQEGVGEYRATWQGIALQLKFIPLARRWWLWMTEGGNTMRAGQGEKLLQWDNARGAKEYIETIALRVIRKMTHPVAQQSAEDRQAVLRQFVKVVTKVAPGPAPAKPNFVQTLRKDMLFVNHGVKGNIKPESAERRLSVVPVNPTKPRIHRKATPVRKLVTK